MNLKRSIRNWYCISFTILGLMALSSAGRSVRGVVSDQNGNPIQGATVQLENTRTLAIRSFITQKDGFYHFHQVDRSVDYKVSAFFHDALSGTKTLSTFDERSIALINLRIDLK